MSLQLRMFKYEHDNEFDNIRTVDIDGEIWFVATDVAKVLGYKKPHDALKAHCKERGTMKYGVPSKGGTQETILINEPNVYRLIVKSQLPSAERFENWLFEEVLPTIRKTGTYGINRIEPPNFVIRYMENFHKISKGCFSIITELYVRLYAQLEHAGYKIPNRAEDGKELRPDVSVGKCFSTFLKTRYPELADNFTTYTHTFPNGKEVEARQYPVEMLSYFIRYVDEVWIPQNATQYFRERDPLALDYLPKLLKSA